MCCRFAAKFLVEMMIVPDMTTYFIESNYLLHFVNLLTSEEDIFMQEYFSTILARLSRNSFAAALLANLSLNMNFLFDGIQSSDPDVKKNNLEILNNLMQDPVAARTILKTEVCYSYNGELVIHSVYHFLFFIVIRNLISLYCINILNHHIQRFSVLH